MAGLIVRNGTVITAEREELADVLCQDGVIRAVGHRLNAPSGVTTIDASGQLVLPGAIDAHTHMEMPFMGTVSADDFESGTAAGLAGGTTTIIDFVIPGRGRSLLEARDLWRENARKACADYGFHMAVTWWGEQVQREIEQVFRQDGITSFKSFLAYRGSLGIADDELLAVFATVGALGGLPMVHCEHGDIVALLQKKLIAEGKTDPKYHAVSRPSYVEGEATGRAIALAHAVGQPLYVVHLTCSEALEAVARARRGGQRVFAETCPQYLVLDDSVYDQPDFEGAAYVMSPPIRPVGHQQPLWGALASGLIQTVATDHCPFRQADQKVMGRGDFTRIPNGAAGVEDRLALLYTCGVATGRITRRRMVEVSSSEPARIFGLYPRKGTIAPGTDADLVVFDPTARARISAATHHQKVDRNIYEGFELTGRVTHTIARGRVQFADGDLRAERGAGRYLRRGGLLQPAPLADQGA